MPASWGHKLESGRVASRLLNGHHGPTFTKPIRSPIRHNDEVLADVMLLAPSSSLSSGSKFCLCVAVVQSLVALSGQPELRTTEVAAEKVTQTKTTNTALESTSTREGTTETAEQRPYWF